MQSDDADSLPVLNFSNGEGLRDYTERELRRFLEVDKIDGNTADAVRRLLHDGAPRDSKEKES